MSYRQPLRWWVILLGLVSGVTGLVLLGIWANQAVVLQPRAIPKDYQVKASPQIKLQHDPQYIVMNFAPMNEYNWAASENDWQREIKPKVVAELRALKSALPAGTNERKLAWSTLMEYMNFPLDQPSSQSAYVVKVRRMFEVTRDENIPLFVPLNGFQWWDELPELYNWWDADGTKTDPRFFARQDDPVGFKRRFIAGYDPDNRYNVEWQDWQTPMQLNWRNWGGGGFRLAPPPNLVEHQRPNKRGLTYRLVQQARFQAIISEIVKQVKTLEEAGKLDLFAGISIGTEISLNASATPKDEFEPYGYRAMQDLLQRDGSSISALTNDVIKQQELRQQAVAEYLTQLSWQAMQLGLPMQRIYTHVWSEAVAGEPRYVDYAASAYNFYSRPGISLYGYATKPLELSVWKKALASADWPAWGAVEFSLPKTQPESDLAVSKFQSARLNQPAPQVVVLYNWAEHNNSTNVASLQRILAESPTKVSCDVPEILNPQLTIKQVAYAQLIPTEFQWQLEDGAVLSSDVMVSLHIFRGPRIGIEQQPYQTIELLPTATSFDVPELPPGVYSWIVEVSGCEGVARRSQPQQFVISSVKQYSNPRWVEAILDFQAKESQLFGEN